MTPNESIAKAASHLLKFQREDGHFEGELSANTFPTCAYALVQKALGRSVEVEHAASLFDDDLIRWFIETQNDDGIWGLDASGGSDSEATLFAKLALKEIKRMVEVIAECSDLPFQQGSPFHSFAAFPSADGINPVQNRLVCI